MGRVRDHKSLWLMVDRFDQINGINWCVLCSSFVHKNFAFSFVARQLLLATEAVAFQFASGHVLFSNLTLDIRRLLGNKVVVLINNVNGNGVLCTRRA